MGGVDDRLSERLLPLNVAGDFVAMVAAHETGHVLGLRDGSYGGGSLTLRDVTSPERVAKNGFAQSIMNYSRSEEHTSELQSLMRISYAVFCWKKKKHKN